MVALALRLLVAVFAPPNPDVLNYGGVVGVIEAGGNIYREFDWYPYSPFWSSVLTALDHLRGDVPLMIAVRVFLSIIDMVNVLLIYHIAAPERRFHAAAFYAFNPVSVLVTSVRGQFEALVLIPTLLAVLMVANYHRTHLEAQQRVPAAPAAGVAGGVSAGADRPAPERRGVPAHIRPLRRRGE